jgi:hypothetical protein
VPRFGVRADKQATRSTRGRRSRIAKSPEAGGALIGLDGGIAAGEHELSFNALAPLLQNTIPGAKGRRHTTLATFTPSPEA